MAFSFRKIISNINYFKKTEDESSVSEDFDIQVNKDEKAYTGASEVNFERPEPDSTSKQCATSLKLPESVKNFAANKGSLSDTDLLTVCVNTKREKRRSKKLKVDIKKANRSVEDIKNSSESKDNVENTPKHILLESKSAGGFSERLKRFDFNRSFDLFDEMSDDQRSSPYDEENIDIESLSDTDTDISLVSSNDDISTIKMCRKVDSVNNEECEQHQLVPSATPESFGEVEVDRNEEDRLNLLFSYQMKLEKIDSFIKKLLSEFQFHIEVSKVFQCRSFVTTLPNMDIANIPTILTNLDTINRGVSPTESWNIIMEKEDTVTKQKVKKQLLSMKNVIDEFINIHLKNQDNKKILGLAQRSITFDLDKGKRVPHKRLRINLKKKIKHFDFPDLREAMIQLFDPEMSRKEISADVTNIISEIDAIDSKCSCRCHHDQSSSTDTDSGLTTKSNDRSMSITSSIGNFTLDSTTLSAYSESLDQVISYNSFQDTNLYSTLLQKAAIERITFYVQVHSIQLHCESTEQDYESKNVITFHCPSCQSTETEENGLLKHILSPRHCEKIHFQYKTAYIKKCVQSGKEIQPSTVLNPMTMYRDENKIVCFGDAMYACSLCFENLIIGESILMAHCYDSNHIERREKLSDIID